MSRKVIILKSYDKDGELDRYTYLLLLLLLLIKLYGYCWCFEHFDLSKST